MILLIILFGWRYLLAVLALLITLVLHWRANKVNAWVVAAATKVERLEEETLKPVPEELKERIFKTKRLQQICGIAAGYGLALMLLLWAYSIPICC